MAAASEGSSRARPLPYIHTRKQKKKILEAAILH